MKTDKESPHFVFSDRTNLADADFNALSREAAGCSRRSKGICVQMARANAFAMETEPPSSYQVLWRHLCFFTGR